MFCLKIDTVNPLLSPQGGLLIMFKGGLNRDGGLFERGAYSIQQRQWYQVSIKNWNTKMKSLEVMQRRSKNKSELPVCK